MKAVILAAGEGTRMRPLTQKTPKSLLKVNNKPIIDYILASLPPDVDEVIIAVKYFGDQIKKYVGDKNHGRKIRYVLGSNKGTAYSFLATKKYLQNERFILINGDEITDLIDVNSCLGYELSILVFKPQNPQKSGMCYFRKDGTIGKIIEKPKKTKSSIAIDGLMVLNTDIFNYKPQPTKGEFYFSTMVGLFTRDHKVFPVIAKNSIFDITEPHDLIRAGKILKARE